MPGPFPGMDPYLESPAYWHGFHNRLISYASEALNANMPPGFIASIEERVYVVESERSLYPDVAILHNPAPPSSAASESVTALLEKTGQHGIVTAYPEERHEWFVQIVTATKPRRIVTIIEILSPANKTLRGKGRQEYQQKQQEILHSDTNLLEIDLLRQGEYTVAVPYPLIRRRGTWHYLACLHRSAQRYKYEYWMNTLPKPLLPVKIPLTEDYPDAILDLQAVFNRSYDAGRYAQEIDYAQPPDIPLDGEDAAWADALLREQQLRP